MNFDDRPARNRVDLAGKTLRFSDHAIAALKELDETVAGYTQAAELFACGLTRRIGPASIAVDRIIAPDQDKILLLSENEWNSLGKLGEIIHYCECLEFRTNGDELIIQGGEPEGFHVEIVCSAQADIPETVLWPEIRPQLERLVSIPLPVVITDVPAAIHKKAGAGIKDIAAASIPWEMIASDQKVRLGRRFLIRIQETADDSQTSPNYAIHYHPHKSKNPGETQIECDRKAAQHFWKQYYKDLLAYSHEDLIAVRALEFDWFEIRGLGSTTRPMSLNDTCSRYYAAQPIWEITDAIARAMDDIEAFISGKDSAPVQEQSARIVYKAINSLIKTGLPVAVTARYAFGAERYKHYQCMFDIKTNPAPIELDVINYLLFLIQEGENKAQLPQFTTAYF